MVNNMFFRYLAVMYCDYTDSIKTHVLHNDPAAAALVLTKTYAPLMIVVLCIKAISVGNPVLQSLFLGALAGFFVGIAAAIGTLAIIYILKYILDQLEVFHGYLKQVGQRIRENKE